MEVVFDGVADGAVTLQRLAADEDGGVARPADDVFAAAPSNGSLAATLVAEGVPCLATAWHFGVSSYHGLLALGVVLGFAGASFASALPLAPGMAR